MQLVAYGAQDVYLTGNPQITFWKVTYRRYTNFAIESIEQTFNGQADFGRRVQCTTHERRRVAVAGVRRWRYLLVATGRAWQPSETGNGSSVQRATHGRQRGGGRVVIE